MLIPDPGRWAEATRDAVGRASSESRVSHRLALTTLQTGAPKLVRRMDKVLGTAVAFELISLLPIDYTKPRGVLQVRGMNLDAKGIAFFSVSCKLVGHCSCFSNSFEVPSH